MKDKFSPAGLDKVKPGDLVAPIRYHNEVGEWTGALLKVTKVGDKRFLLGGSNWVDKATGRSVSSHGYYVLATKDMIADVERKRQQADKRDEDEAAYHARTDYRYASAILAILDEMRFDHHPLDRLTLEEWAMFYDKLLREP